MSRSAAAPNARQSVDRQALIAAYCEGLGLAALAVIGGPEGFRIAVVEQGSSEPLAPGETVQARWWCRRPAHADCVAAAANARLRRRRSRADATRTTTPVVRSTLDATAADVHDVVARAAKHCAVLMQSDQEVFDEASAVIVRVDDEIARMQRSGELRSVNKSYQDYRIEASGCGEPTMRYQEWMNNYKEDLVRKLAAALRSL